MTSKRPAVGRRHLSDLAVSAGGALGELVGALPVRDTGKLADRTNYQQGFGHAAFSFGVRRPIVYPYDVTV